MVGYEPKYTMRLPVHRERGNGGRSLDPHCDSLSLMHLAYFDCFSGISGDMALGGVRALLDEAGLPGAADVWVTTAVGPGGEARLTLSALAPAERRDQILEVSRAYEDFGDIRMVPTVRRSR